MEDYHKYNRAYFIRFITIESDTYLKNYILPNFVTILDEAAFDCIAIEEDKNGQDCMILFLEDIKINEFIYFCDDENLIDSHQDITIKLLLDDNLDEVIKEMILSEEFEDKFNKFFEKNVTMDTVLDKILINGEGSLTEFEFNLLENEVMKLRKKNLN
jgi:hypothetical protein